MEKTSSSSFSLFTFLLISLHVISTCIAMNIRTDQSSLLALKAHITSDPNHILPANRSSSSTSVCNWIRITCGSRHQRVTVLNVSGMGFTGTIPPQLDNLSFLVSLDLSYNNFHGVPPPEISRLRKLRAVSTTSMEKLVRYSVVLRTLKCSPLKIIVSVGSFLLLFLT